MNLLLATEGGGFHVPPLEELFEFPAFLFEGSEFFALNRTGMLYLLAALLAGGLMLVAFSNAKIVPGRFQAAMEAVVDFVRNNIVVEVMGPEGLRFVPVLVTLFLFIWINNLFEIMPFVNFPSTGRMAMPAMLAIMVWAMFIITGMIAQGPISYFKGIAFPPGVPGPILILVAPIEIVSTFIVRPLTLAVRLFANMMAGHIVLTIAFIAANAFFLDVHNGLGDMTFNLKGAPVGLIAFAGSVALVAFELMVGFLQAYIFTILAAVYLSGSLSPEH